MLGFIDDPKTNGERWLRYSGLQTLHSFGVSGISQTSSGADLEKARDALYAAMGADLVEWVADLPKSWVSGNVAFVHAGADPAVAISGPVASNPLPVVLTTPCRCADGLLGDATGPVSGSPHLLRATIADRPGKGKGCAQGNAHRAVLARQSLPVSAMFTRYVRNCLAGDKGALFHIRCFPPFFMLARHLLTRLAEEWPAQSG